MLPSGSNPLACGKAPGLPASALRSHTPLRILSHSSKASKTCIFQNRTLSCTGFSTYWPDLRAQEQESSVAICSTSSTATACDQIEQMLGTKEVTFALSCFLNHVLLLRKYRFAISGNLGHSRNMPTKGPVQKPNFGVAIAHS